MNSLVVNVSGAWVTWVKQIARGNVECALIEVGAYHPYHHIILIILIMYHPCHPCHHIIISSYHHTISYYRPVVLSSYLVWYHGGMVSLGITAAWYHLVSGMQVWYISGM
jgi:hypothetical protein